MVTLVHIFWLISSIPHSLKLVHFEQNFSDFQQQQQLSTLIPKKLVFVIQNAKLPSLAFAELIIDSIFHSRGAVWPDGYIIFQHLAICNN